MFKLTPNNFKLSYQFREYHFTPEQIQHAKPPPPGSSRVDLFRIHKHENIFGLILVFYVSFALSARKTALILRMVFNINVSYQTVLNYAQAAAYYAHQFNMAYKPDIDDFAVGDETYIKVLGQNHYVWFFISPKNHVVTAYHLSDNRETDSAVAAIKEAIRTAEEHQQITIISDGCESYTHAIHFLNSLGLNKELKHIKVIGLKNRDEVSKQYRPFKQLIERFNRTYKHHVRPANGFNSFNGAMALTTLFVTYYNYLRPHSALKYKVPIEIATFTCLNTLQEKWVRLIEMMF